MPVEIERDTPYPLAEGFSYSQVMRLYKRYCPPNKRPPDPAIQIGTAATWVHKNTYAVWTGETRRPMPGEWFLIRANNFITARKAVTHDLLFPQPIARLIRIEEVVTMELHDLTPDDLDG